MPRRKKHIPFSERPRHFRSEAVVRLRGRIKKEGKDALFVTRHILENSSWADFYFLSVLDRTVFFNATVETHSSWIEQRCDDMAQDELDSRIQIDVRHQSMIEAITFERHYDKFGRRLPWSTMKFRERPRYQELDGLTEMEFLEKEKQRLLNASEVFAVPVGSTVNEGYAYGTGLNVVVESKFITLDVVNDFIREFRANGERPMVVERMLRYMPIEFPDLTRQYDDCEIS